MSRRTLLANALKGGAILALPVLSGCGKKELVCSDTAGLSMDDTNARRTLGYTDRATDPQKACEKCQLYKPAAPDTCGGCGVVKGPIHPAGTCNAFAAKQT